MRFDLDAGTAELPCAESTAHSLGRESSALNFEQKPAGASEPDTSSPLPEVEFTYVGPPPGTSSAAPDLESTSLASDLGSKTLTSILASMGGGRGRKRKTPTSENEPEQGGGGA